MGKKSRRKHAVSSSTAAEEPRQSGSARRAAALISAALLILVFTIYGQLGGHAFVNYDDPDYVTNNPHVLGGLTWAGIQWAFTTTAASNWHPLTWISHMTDVQLFGTNAGAHLLENAALHALNSILLFLFLWMATQAIGESAAVAALFAAHPLHVESVAWISERKDVLSTSCFLLCLIAYCKYVRRSSRLAYGASLIAFLCGLLVKPMLVSTPVVLLLLDVWPFGRLDASSLWRRLAEKVPFALLTIPSIIATLLAQRGAMTSTTRVPLAARLANAAMSYVKYLEKTFWPTHLSVMYPFPTRIDPRIAIACALIIVAMTVAVIALRRRMPWLFVGWLFFVVTLVPVIGIVQVGLQAMADRYTYIPHIGLFVALVWSAASLLPRQRAALAATAAVATLSLAAVAYGQAAYWRNSETLFAHALSVTSSNNKLAHVNLGGALLDKGDYADAEREYRLAQGFEPASTVKAGLGTALLKQDKVTEAMAVIGDVPDAALHNNLAAALAKHGDDNRAKREYEFALEIDPGFYDAHMNYGALLSRMDRDADARRQFEAAARLQPNAPEPYIYLALLDANQHRFAEAQHNVEQAIAINHDASNRILIDAIRIPTRPTAVDEYLTFLRGRSGGR